MKLTQKEKETIIEYIESSIKETKGESRFMIEVLPMSLSTDVEISVIPNDVYVQTFRKQSIIDWENYDF